jgi:hypothetical protein
MRFRPILLGLPPLALLAAAIAAGCGHGKAAATSASGSGGGDAGASCPSGQAMAADGTCQVVGVQGCADVFVDPDGLCRPSTAKCKAGTIPSFSNGCVAVGIPDCAAAFVGADGLCHASMTKCPSGTMALPQKGCVSVDGPDGCGAAPWGAIPDGPANVYVDPSYMGNDGDGSKQKPFTTVNAALAVVAPGGRVALAAGTYTESLAIQHDVEIDGRCPSMVTIDGNDGDPSLPTIVSLNGGSLTLRGLTLTGDGTAVLAENATGVTLDRLVITDTLQTAISVFNGPYDVTITNTLVQGTRSMAGLLGFGVDATGGVSVTIQDSAFYQNRSSALLVAAAPTTASLTDVLLEATGPDEGTQNFGEGLVVQGGATVDLTAVAVVNNHLSGIEPSDPGSLVTATSVVVEGTLPQISDMALGVGVEVFNGGAITLTGSAVLASHAAGVFASDSGTKATLQGTLVYGTLTDVTTGKLGRGLDAQNGAVVTVDACAFVKNHELGVVALDPGTAVTTQGLLVEDTQKNAAGEWGGGLIASTGAALHLTGTIVSGGTIAGVLASEATVDATQCLFTGIQGGTFVLLHPTMTYTGVGDGAIATRGANLTLKQTRSEGCARAGMLFDTSEGSVTGSMAIDNEFGLVVDGATMPTVDTASTFTGNAKGARVNDANLPVPDAPAPVP